MHTLPWSLCSSFIVVKFFVIEFAGLEAMIATSMAFSLFVEWQVEYSGNGQLKVYSDAFDEICDTGRDLIITASN